MIFGLSGDQDLKNLLYLICMADEQIGGFESAGAASEKELHWSGWWVDHREAVRKAGLGLFIAVDAALMIFGLWGFVDWLALGGVKEEQAIRQMTGPDYGRFGGVGLEEVQLGAPFVLPSGSGKSDILASIENRNEGFWAEIEYRFIIGGVEGSVRKTFVLPGQTKYLADLGGPEASGAGVELKIERRLWHRAGLLGAESRQALYETRLNVAAENPVFKPSDPSATSPVSSSSFKLVNGTAFGYYDVDLLVLLYRGDSVVGVNKIRVDRLPAGASRPIDLFWYQTLPAVSRVEVMPEINIYDEGIYESTEG